jgi:hypothetical protein
MSGLICQTSGGRGSGVRFKLWYSGKFNHRVHTLFNGPLEFLLIIDAESPKTVGSFGVTLYDQNGTKLVNTNIEYLERVLKLNQGENQIKVTIEELHLTPGIYTIGLWAADASGDIYEHIPEAIKVEVVNQGSEWFGTKGDGLVTCYFDISQIVS